MTIQERIIQLETRKQKKIDELEEISHELNARHRNYPIPILDDFKEILKNNNIHYKIVNNPYGLFGKDFSNSIAYHCDAHLFYSLENLEMYVLKNLKNKLLFIYDCKIEEKIEHFLKIRFATIEVTE